MDLVESYLVEVQQHLPKVQRRDIVRELRTTIEEQVSDHADALGRLPSRDDELVVLADFGHPLKVASGYREQRYLIGPEIFPSYLRTLKLVLAIALIAQFVVSFVAAYFAEWHVSIWGLIDSAISVFAWVLVVVTLVFIAIEYSGEKLNWYADWKPTSLNSDTTSVASRRDIISNFVTEGVFLLWWNDILRVQSWLPELGAEFPLCLSVVWDVFHWPLNIIFGIAFVLHAYTLLRGVWHRMGLLTEIASNVALLAAGFVLLSSADLIDIDLQTHSVVNAIQWTVKSIILVIAGFCGWDAWVALRQLRGMTSAA